MIDRFLKAKHWQVFLLIYSLPFIPFIIDEFIRELTLEIIGYYWLFYVIFLFILTLVPILLFFLWNWSITIGLKKKVPNFIHIEYRKFRFLVWLPSIFYCGIFISMIIYINILGLNVNDNYQNTMVGISLFLILISFICILYVSYFTSKIIKTVELQKKVDFSYFTNEFFAICLFPFGIWFIQPKINKLALKKPETIEDIGLNNNNLD